MLKTELTNALAKAYKNAKSHDVTSGLYNSKTGNFDLPKTNISRYTSSGVKVNQYNNETGKLEGKTFYPKGDNADVTISADGDVYLRYFKHGKEQLEQNKFDNLPDFIKYIRSKADIIFPQ